MSANVTIKDIKTSKSLTVNGVEIVKLPIPGELSLLVNITFRQQLYKIRENNNIDNIAPNKLEILVLTSGCHRLMSILQIQALKYDSRITDPTYRIYFWKIKIDFIHLTSLIN